MKILLLLQLFLSWPFENVTLWRTISAAEWSVAPCSPQWIKKISLLHQEVKEKKLWRGKKRSGLKLPLAFFSLFIFFFSPKEGREKEATGDLLDYQCDAHGLNEPEKKEGGDVQRGVKGKGVGVKRRDWCVHFLPSLLVGSRQWIFTQASPFLIRWGWKVCENSAHDGMKERRRRSVNTCVTCEWGEDKNGNQLLIKRLNSWGTKKSSFILSFFDWPRAQLPLHFIFTIRFCTQNL